ncbi:MAG: hypothetical protein ACN4GW_15725 [Desulforhopalus sp.]
MAQDSELKRLEKFVEKLLGNFSELKAEKGRLEQKLFESELKIEELQGDISTKNIERTEISERVNKIVDQIEEWEQSLDEPAAEAGEDSSEDDEEEDEEPEEENSGEEEGRVQHNLFSMDGTRG